MFKKTMLFIAFMCITGFIFADTVIIPNTVTEIKSATYSSGGGKTGIVYVKILCTDKGRDVLYMDSKFSKSGLVGIGRYLIPKKIEFVRHKAIVGEIIFK